MLISQGNFNRNMLLHQIAIVTGAGRGIGFEAAKALVWLGAKVIIAEIDDKNGKFAEEAINNEFGAGNAFFVHTDIGNEKDIDRLSEVTLKKYGKVDIVLNNATVFPMGAVKETPIDSWDFSYRVNLRGPVLLVKKFLPSILKRKMGVFVFVSSSGAAPYMGAYEVFKTAQVELANTLSAELQDSGVYAFTIGPGISKTPGFIDGGGKVASFMGMTLEQLFELNKNAQISPEAAGTGFALAIALAEKYNGQEISSIQVLREANIPLTEQEEVQFKEQTQQTPIAPKPMESRNVDKLYEVVSKTFIEQSEGWKRRNLFERQWVSRDFKKNTGLSIDEMQATMTRLGNNLENNIGNEEFSESLGKLTSYYLHQQEQLRGFEKDPQKLEKNLKIIDGWIADIKALLEALAR